jgi:hypothetical protein
LFENYRGRPLIFFPPALEAEKQAPPDLPNGPPLQFFFVPPVPPLARFRIHKTVQIFDTHGLKIVPDPG